MSQDTDTAPLHALKHEAKPGFPQLFEFVFAVMFIYLAVIFLLSSVSVDKGDAIATPATPAVPAVPAVPAASAAVTPPATTPAP